MIGRAWAYLLGWLGDVMQDMVAWLHYGWPLLFVLAVAGLMFAVLTQLGA